MLLAVIGGSYSLKAQLAFDPTIQPDFNATTVVMPASPLKYQVLFIGGVDKVQTLDGNGMPNGETYAKQWHDFIGFTPDNSSSDLGWLSVNHEMVIANDSIGDGGGMTVFKIARDQNTDTLMIVNQTLTDGRSGDYFNVDFVNTVGETGMNCGGITSAADGRIWTAEEWWRYDNAHIYSSGNGIRDTADFTIANSGISGADGQTIKKYQNFNYMVEIDPKEAKAIRKQYNWGRQSFEGGAILPDNQTVFLGVDDTPGFLTKFVANTPGDFTSGKTYVFKENNQEPSLSYKSSVKDLASEIIAYDDVNAYMYSTDADSGHVHVHSVSGGEFTYVRSIDVRPYGEEPTSVAVHNGVAAVSVVDVVGTQGKVVFIDNTGNIIGQATVGYHPDMVIFSPDGNYVLTANEGEPDDNYTIDPDGSISVIDVSGGFASPVVADAGFGSYTIGMLTNVRIYGNGTTNVAQDMEPEFITVDANSQKAYVTCQENNAIAVVDLATATVTNILGLGYKDYSQMSNAIDPSDKDFIDGNFATYPVLGMYQPDAIVSTMINGTTYLITSNEGDARDYNTYTEEFRLKDTILDPTVFPNAAFLQQDSVLGRLKISMVNADTDMDGDVDVIYSYGARSFSIWDTTGALVYDSGNDLAKRLLEIRPANFPDNRSDDKGTEPESIEVAVIDGQTYVFIGLERATGVMVYDITNPMAPTFVDYYNNDATDQSPEGLDFANINGNNYLFVGNEAFSGYDGSLSTYEVIGGALQSNWIEVDNTDLDKMLNYKQQAINARATMFNRLEWVAYNQDNGKVYLTETGRDNPASRWLGESLLGATHASHTMYRALQQNTHPDSSDYYDYYGRVLEFDPVMDEVKVHLEAGPYFAASSVPAGSYPSIHLSNPDGLNFLHVGGKTFMIICEDLNGTSHGRVPGNVSGRMCELYLLDMSIANPTINDLIRISMVPQGAEVTGAMATPDGKSIIINSQHPSSSNPYPYNNSLTYAITGFDAMVATGLVDEPAFQGNGFEIYPNPATRNIVFNEVTDIAIYDASGKRMLVQRNVKSVDVSGLSDGVYFVKNLEGDVQKLIIQK